MLSNFNFSPIFHSKLTANKGFRKAFFIEKIVRNQISDDVFYIFFMQSHLVKFVPNFLLSTFLVSTIIFNLQFGLMRSIFLFISFEIFHVTNLEKMIDLLKNNGEICFEQTKLCTLSQI